MIKEARNIKKQVISSVVAFAVLTWCCLVLLLSPPSTKIVSASPDNFGYTTIGTAGSQNIGDRITGSVFTCPDNCIADNITAYLNYTTDGTSLRYAIYRHSDNTLVAQTEGYLYSFEGTSEWVTLNFTSPKPTLIANTDYVLVAFAVNYMPPSMNYDYGGATVGHYQDRSYDDGFPSTASFLHENRKYSIYCTYTPGPPRKPSLTSPDNNSWIVSYTSVTFTWTSVSNADNYRIEIDNDNNWSNGVVDNQSVVDTSWTKTAGYSSGTYKWRVWTHNSFGDNVSDNVFTLNVTSKPGKPVLISPEKNSVLKGNKPTFTWIAGANADNHRIEVGNDDNWANGVVDNVVVAAPNDNTWTKPDPGYALGTYYWRVWARNAVGENCSENTWEFTVVPPGSKFAAWFTPENSVVVGKAGTSGCTAVLHITIRNLESVAENYSISATTSDNNWSLALSDNKVEIGAGGKNDLITLSVASPAFDNRSHDSTSIEIKISLTSDDNINVKLTSDMLAVYMFNGWNLNSIPVTDENATPNKIFSGTTYMMYYWTAPNGPYNEPTYSQPVKPGLGYWIKLDNYLTCVCTYVRDNYEVAYGLAAAWQVIETWTGIVEAPVTWQLIKTWTGVVQAPIPGTPAKVSPADGASTNDNTPTFIWNLATDNIAVYEIWVDNDNDFLSPEILDNTINTEYTPVAENALPDDNYSWRVRAWNQAGNPGLFEPAWTFVIDTVAPPAPELVSPENNAVIYW